MSNSTLGIDPGPTLDKCWGVGINDDGEITSPYMYAEPSDGVCSGSDVLAMIQDLCVIMPDSPAIIIELPVQQGKWRFHKEVIETRDMAISLANLALKYTENVYLVPAQVIRYQVTAYNPRTCGKADPHIKRHCTLLGHDCTAGGILGDSVDENGRVCRDKNGKPIHDGVHKRDAAIAALWNWSDPRNQEYKYRGLSE